MDTPEQIKMPVKFDPDTLFIEGSDGLVILEIYHHGHADMEFVREIGRYVEKALNESDNS